MASEIGRAALQQNNHLERFGVNLAAIVRSPQVGAGAVEAGRVVDEETPIAIRDDEAGERVRQAARELDDRNLNTRWRRADWPAGHHGP